MGQTTERLNSTICSALVSLGNKYAFKETENGKISFLGGHMNWEYGVSDAIIRRTYADTGIAFTPRYINGITQHRTPSGKEVININIVGNAVDLSNQRPGKEVNAIHWLTREEALRQRDRFRTPEMHYLLQRLSQQNAVSLDFIQSSDQRLKLETQLRVADGAIGTESEEFDGLFGPKDFVVVSTALRYQGPETLAKYAFMRCKRKQFNNKLSLFGGKQNRGEHPKQTAIRETSEESGGLIIPEPIGIIGIWTNRVTKYQDQPSNYATNIATVAEVNELVTELPESVRDESGKEIYWLTLEEIANMSYSEFRTRDAKEIPIRAEQVLQQQRIIPFSFIEQIGV